MPDQHLPSEVEIRRLGAEMRMAWRDYINAVWALVDEELADFPEARERVLQRLDLVRRQRGRRPKSHLPFP